MLSHYISQPTQGLQFGQLRATIWRPEMSDENSSHIVRVQDGSIDYRYYAAQGLMARSQEMKIIMEKVLGVSQMKPHAFPALFTVVLLVLVF